MQGKSSAGFDEIPEFLAKKFTLYYKTLYIYLTYVLNLEFSYI